MGADHVVNSRDSAALKDQYGKFDLLLSTVNVSLDWKSYLHTLAPHGTYICWDSPLNRCRYQ